MTKLSNAELTLRLEKLLQETNSPLTKAVIQHVLSYSENLSEYVELILEGQQSAFLHDDDAQLFFYCHQDEIDQMLRDFDNTSIGKMILEFFFELQRDLAHLAFDHTIRRSLALACP